MLLNEQIGCLAFPCQDVRHDRYNLPQLDLNPEQVRIVLVSEAAPPDSSDDYYATGNPAFQQTTVQAFREAGAEVDNFQAILDLGVYPTSAVKCAKIGYGIKAATINECSHILERELDQFPQLEVYLLMGDVAIKALNTIARRGGESRVIPAGSTYKLRRAAYNYRGRRAIPSYLQVGPSYGIEQSKRRMIAEDIRTALELTGWL